MPERLENNWVHSLDIAFSSSATPLDPPSVDSIIMAYGWTRDTVDQPWTGGEQTTELITTGDTFQITIFDTDQSDDTKVKDNINITALAISVKDEHGRSISPFNDDQGNNKGGSWSHSGIELHSTSEGTKVTGSGGCKVRGRTWWTPSYIVALAGKFKITIDLTIQINGSPKRFKVDPEVDIEGAG